MDAKAWDARYAAAELVWEAEPNPFVRAQCERLPVGQAIDLACGEGRNALWLARLGWRVTGIDYSQVAIERARALATRERPAVAVRLVWRVGDVTVEPIKPSRYDLALISCLHLPEYQITALVRRAAAAVAPRGHLLMIGHGPGDPAESAGDVQDGSPPYDADAIREILNAVPHLLVEFAKTIRRETPTGIAFDTVVRARRPASA